MYNVLINILLLHITESDAKKKTFLFSAITFFHSKSPTNAKVIFKVKVNFSWNVIQKQLKLIL